MLYYVGDIVEQIDEIIEQRINGHSFVVPSGAVGSIIDCDNYAGRYAIHFQWIDTLGYPTSLITLRTRDQIRPHTNGELAGIRLAGYDVRKIDYYDF